MRARSITTVIIGGGHSGLAMSRCLSELGIDHVVLERGAVANSWRHERWDSLRLLTPNWQCRLPGHAYSGDRPDDFMTMQEVIRFIDGYARLTSAPVEVQTEVRRVYRTLGGYIVATNRGDWICRSLVLANGSFSIPKIPSLADSVPADIDMIDSKHYRNPDQLAPGGVLVVGSSATGLQLAKEIHESGRPVTLATGEHVRMPRNYRGKDILWWLEVTGRSDESYRATDDLLRARRVPSPQLIGTADRSTVDLNSLTDRGIRLVGRLSGISGDRCQFSGSLRNHCKLADLKMGRLLNEIDQWILDKGAEQEFPPAGHFEPTRVEQAPMTTARLSDFRTIVWATGYRPDYSWLDLPVLDRRGNLLHDGGVVTSPGVYAMGLPFMRKRKSTFIHGAEDDARDLSQHLYGYLANQQARVAG